MSLTLVTRDNCTLNTITSLPLELLHIIISQVTTIWPPGWRTCDVEGRHDVPEGGLGWITLSHVCKLWRSLLLGISKIWAESVFAFVTPHAVEEIMRRSGKENINVDIDATLMASRLRDLTPFIDWVMSHAKTIMPRAQSIVSTMGLNTGILYAIDYSRGVLDSDYICWVLEDVKTFPALTRLTLPISSDGKALPKIEAPLLQFVAIVAVKSTQSIGWTRPQYEGYTTERMRGEECTCDLTHLIDFLKTVPHLRSLVLDTVQVLDDDDPISTPIHMNALIDVRIVSVNVESITSMMTNIVTPTPWDIMTHIHDSVTLPGFIRSDIERYNHITIQHSYSPTLVTFSASKLSDVEISRRFSETLRVHNVHITKNSVTFGWKFHETHPAFSEYARDASTLTIDALRGLSNYYPTSYKPRMHWDFLLTVNTIESLNIQDEPCAKGVLSSLRKPPRHVTILCGPAQGTQDSSLGILHSNLDRWKKSGLYPDSVTLKGLKGSLPSPQHDIPRWDNVHVRDLRRESIQ